MTYDLQKSDQQWRSELSPQEYRVLRQEQITVAGRTLDTFVIQSDSVTGGAHAGTEHDVAWPGTRRTSASIPYTQREGTFAAVDGIHVGHRLAQRCDARTAAHISGTSSPARASTPRPTSGIASTASRCSWSRPRRRSSDGG